MFTAGREDEHGCVTPPPFDIDLFLSQPLTARVATEGPTVRPVWFLWEEDAFWVLTGPWAKLYDRVGAAPQIALVVDVCDLSTGLVRQVIARGRAELLPFDMPRGRRKLTGTSGRTNRSGIRALSAICTMIPSCVARRGCGCRRHL